MKIDLDDGIIDMRGAKIDATTGKYVADTASHIHIDVKSPYFKIDSVEGNTLMFIGGKEEGYYLQSDEYNETKFTLNETESNGLTTPSTDTTGTGMRLDLKEGTLDAFDFYLTSKNVMLNSKDSSKPYFVIKDNYNNMLMHIGSTNFWLKSADYSEDSSGNSEAGMKIDLTNGKIDAFNFSLVSDRVKLSTSGTITKPYLEIVGNNTTLMHISEEYQIIRSDDFEEETSSAAGKGMEIDLGTGDFTAYTFRMKAGNSSEGYLQMSSSASQYPLWLGTSLEASKFKVDWAGNLTCTNITASGGTFSGSLSGATGTFSGTVSAGTVIGSEIYIPSKENAVFSVSGAGRLIATSANIGGWEVAPTENSGFTSGAFSVTPTGLSFTGSAGGITVNKDGLTTIDKLKITNSIECTNDCTIKFLGQMGINASPFSDYDLYVYGKTMLLGHVGIGIGAKDDYALSISNKLYVGSNVCIKDGCVFTNDSNQAKIKFSGSGLFFNDTNNFQVISTGQVWLQAGGGERVVIHGDAIVQGGTFTVQSGDNVMIGTQSLPDYIKNNANIFGFNTMTEQDIRNIIESYGYSTSSGISLSDVANAGYVTKSYVHNYGTVDYGGDPSHKHTFRLP